MAKHKPTKISSVANLATMLDTHEKQNGPYAGPLDFFVSLAGGMIKSSKSIQLRGYNKRGRPSFYVYNEVDDTRQLLTADSLFEYSNIGEAIETGNFYAY